MTRVLGAYTVPERCAPEGGSGVVNVPELSPTQEKNWLGEGTRSSVWDMLCFGCPTMWRDSKMVGAGIGGRVCTQR